MDERVAFFSSTKIPPKSRHRNAEQEQLCRVTSRRLFSCPEGFSRRGGGIFFEPEDSSIHTHFLNYSKLHPQTGTVHALKAHRPVAIVHTCCFGCSGPGELPSWERDREKKKASLELLVIVFGSPPLLLDLEA